MLCFWAVGKNLDEDDNTKAETAKMQKEYESLKDSTKQDQPSTSQSTKQLRTECTLSSDFRYEPV